MLHVHDLASADQRIEGPGIWLMAGESQFGLKPERSADGRECVPFSWATEFPPVGEFMARFPGYWVADRVAEVWRGQVHNPVGIYWCRYDPRAVLKG